MGSEECYVEGLFPGLLFSVNKTCQTPPKITPLPSGRRSLQLTHSFLPRLSFKTNPALTTDYDELST